MDVRIWFEVSAIATAPDALDVEIVARYPDGSYDRSSGRDMPEAMDRLGQKIASYLTEAFAAKQPATD